MLKKKRYVFISSFYRSQIFIHLFANKDSAVVHRAVAALPPGGGSTYTGRWQCCHRAVYDGRMEIWRRENLDFQTEKLRFRQWQNRRGRKCSSAAVIRWGLAALVRHDVEHAAVGLIHGTSANAYEVAYAAVYVVVDDALYAAYAVALHGEHG